ENLGLHFFARHRIRPPTCLATTRQVVPGGDRPARTGRAGHARPARGRPAYRRHDIGREGADRARRAAGGGDVGATPGWARGGAGGGPAGPGPVVHGGGGGLSDTDRVRRQIGGAAAATARIATATGGGQAGGGRRPAAVAAATDRGRRDGGGGAAAGADAVGA